MTPEPKKTPKEHIQQALPLIYLIVSLLALRWTIVEPYVVPTGSMEPTLKTGDRLYAMKCAYDVRFPFTDWILFRTGDVKRGDVILFLAPHSPGTTYVKRAIGLPNDRVRVESGSLFINGEEIKKEETKEREVMYDIDSHETKTLYIEKLGDVRHWVILDRNNDRSYASQEQHYRNLPEQVVPEGHYFAVGDNRDNSYDSRGWGFVPYKNMKGKGMFIWFSSWEWRLRPERIGTLIQ